MQTLDELKAVLASADFNSGNFDVHWWAEQAEIVLSEAIDEIERLREALHNTVRHFREDNCTDGRNCPYIDAAEKALLEGSE